MAHGQHVVLACDPSLEGVLAAVGITYLAHARAGQVRLGRVAALQAQLGEQVVRVPSHTDDDTVTFARRVLHGYAARVTHGCRRQRNGRCPISCSGDCVRRLVIVAASDDPSMPEVMHQYLRLGFAVGPRIHGMIADRRVAAFCDMARSVLGECEHTRQFVRFSRMADGTFVAAFSPKANAIPLTAGHFAARMGTERFCLVDPIHRVAAFHEPGQRSCTLSLLDEALARDLSSRTDLADDERYVRAMWQRFYQATGTPGRGKDQRGYDLRTSWMPQRLWGGLTEFGMDAAGSAALLAPERYQDAEQIASALA